jgi:hypothetical protein
MSRTLFLALTASLALACGKSDTQPASFHITGTAPTGALNGLTVAGSRTVTHVMAVNPQTASPDRVVDAVASDGHFDLQVTAGRPYVLVFIDSTQRGTDMIVGIFKADTLDTVAPVHTDGTLDLKNVGIDPNHRVASAGISYDALLTQLGLSADAALTLGAVDDLSLRLANPDIDGDGQIDALAAGQTYWVDFHVRTENMRIGGVNGAEATVADIVGKYLDASGANAGYTAFNLASIYANSPTAFDGATYVANGSLSNGGGFTATQSGGSTPDSPSSYSGSPYSDRQQWGPDYNLASVQMPGSGGAPARLVYSLAGGKALTFPNVITRTQTELESVGTVVPFLKINTTDGTPVSVITSVDYTFMKRTSATEWVAATDEEVGLIVNDNGAFVNFYLGSKSTPASFKLPRQASGSVTWSASNTTGSGASATQIAQAKPSDICSMAISYDDKLGLRMFAGNVAPVSGTTPCN